MANYNVTTKLIFGNKNDLASSVSAYLNSVDDTKTIRAIVIEKLGGDNFVVMIVHDA